MSTIITRKIALITGGAGFVGSNLARALLLQKYTVHILSKNSTKQWRLTDIQTKIHRHTISLLDKNALEKLITHINPTVIYHLAAHGGSSSQKDHEEIFHTNILGTFNLLMATKDIPYTLFVNTGSSSEYGKKNKPMAESDSINPTFFYAAAKASATYMAQVFAKEFNKPIVTFRLFSVYGPYEQPGRFIPTITKNLIEQTPIQLTAGNQRRDFVFIDDVVDAYMQAIKHATKLSGEICNIGTGYEYSNDEVVKKLFRVTKKKTVLKKGAYAKRSWDTPHWVADVSHTKKVLGWKSKYSIDTGLLKTYSWFQENLQLYTV